MEEFLRNRRNNETERLEFISSLPNVSLSFLESILPLKPSIVADFIETFNIFRDNFIDEYDVYMSFRVTAILCLLELRKHLRNNTLDDTVFTHQRDSETHILSNKDLYVAAYSDIMTSWDDRFQSKRSTEDLALQDARSTLLNELSSIDSLSLKNALCQACDTTRCQVCKKFVYTLYLRNFD